MPAGRHRSSTARWWTCSRMTTRPWAPPSPRCGNSAADTARRFAADAIMDLFASRGATAGIVLRGTEGYGLAHHLRSDVSRPSGRRGRRAPPPCAASGASMVDRLLRIGRRVPVVTTVVDTPDRISRWWGVIDDLTGENGLVTSEMVPAMRATAPGSRLGGLGVARQMF